MPTHERPPTREPDPNAPTSHDFWRRWLADRDYCLRMCTRWLRGDRQEAEEVLSRGSLRALEYLRNHPGGVEKFRPWILRILHNLCVDTLSAAGRVEPHAAPDGDEPALPCTRALPDRVIYSEQLREAITDAVARLPPRLSTAFVLRFIDDLDYDAMCEHLDISPENARKRVQQARAHLRGELARVA
jgi:RNA polymerase sigma-70 factor (ECF subfamily)